MKFSMRFLCPKCYAHYKFLKEIVESNNKAKPKPKPKKESKAMRFRVYECRYCKHTEYHSAKGLSAIKKHEIATHQRKWVAIIDDQRKLGWRSKRLPKEEINAEIKEVYVCRYCSFTSPVGNAWDNKFMREHERTHTEYKPLGKGNYRPKKLGIVEE